MIVEYNAIVCHFILFLKYIIHSLVGQKQNIIEMSEFMWDRDTITICRCIFFHFIYSLLHENNFGSTMTATGMFGPSVLPTCHLTCPFNYTNIISIQIYFRITLSV